MSEDFPESTFGFNDPIANEIANISYTKTPCVITAVMCLQFVCFCSSDPHEHTASENMALEPRFIYTYELAKFNKKNIIEF